MVFWEDKHTKKWVLNVTRRHFGLLNLEFNFIEVFEISVCKDKLDIKTFSRAGFPKGQCLL